MKIEELNLQVRTTNCLKLAKIDTVDKLKKCSINDLLRVKNLGRKSFDEIVAKLKELGTDISIKVN